MIQSFFSDGDSKEANAAAASLIAIYMTYSSSGSATFTRLLAKKKEVLEATL